MSPKKVIFNTNDLSSAQGLINALEEIGVKPCLTSSLIEIKKLIEEDKVSLIILDTSLGEVESVNLAREIRSTEKAKLTPLLFVYGDLAYKDFVTKTIEFSPVDLVPAPVKIDDFKIKVFTIIFTQQSGAQAGMPPPIIREFEKLQKWTLFAEKISDIVVITDMEWRIVWHNNNFETAAGSEVIKNISNFKLRHFFISPEITFDKLIAILLEKGEWYGEMNFVKADATEICTRCRFELIRDADGKPESVLVIARDVTEVKNLKKQLERSQRMESIGTLASGAAHDINNLLAPVVLGVSMLRERVKDHEGMITLDLIENQCKKASDVLRKILGFAKAMPGYKVLVNPKHIIREVATIAEATFPRTIKLVSIVPANLWTIHAEPTQLHQVFLNLVINARDAMPEGGTLEIRAKNFTIDESISKIEPLTKARYYVVVSVTDTGTGIPEEIMDKIFEPFFTTKTPDVGTGLGLSMAKGIVEEHGGFIKVKSVVGKGSTFEVWLPARPGEEEFKPEKNKKLFHGNGETVLVVDDELQVLQITKSILEKNGYNVIVAKNGIEAVGVVANKRSLIKVAVCDLDMPQMDGVSTMQAMRLYEPALPLIVMSGWASPQFGEKLKKLKYFARLDKPFSPEELLAIIYEAIHGIRPDK